MKKILFLLLAISFFNVQQVLAQKKKQADNLKPYFLVLLKKGSIRDQDSATAAQIQKGHIENINRMAAAGKLNVAGPFLDEGDLRGIFIFDCTTEDEVKQLCNNDPAIKSGRLTYEIHPWMTQRGTCFK